MALQDAFVETRITFAVTHETEDRAVARDALERALAIETEHPDARRRRHRLAVPALEEEALARPHRPKAQGCRVEIRCVEVVPR